MALAAIVLDDRGDQRLFPQAGRKPHRSFIKVGGTFGCPRRSPLNHQSSGFRCLHTASTGRSCRPIERWLSEADGAQGSRKTGDASGNKRADEVACRQVSTSSPGLFEQPFDWAT